MLKMPLAPVACLLVFLEGDLLPGPECPAVCLGMDVVGGVRFSGFVMIPNCIHRVSTPLSEEGWPLRSHLDYLAAV